MTRILIADDHQIFNDGLKNILSAKFNVVAQIFHGNEVLFAIQKYAPKIVVLDINLPGMSGLEIGKEIKKAFPELKLLYLSMYNEPNFVKAAREISADGYMLKDSSGVEILAALQAIENGERHFDKKLNQNKPNLHQDDYFVKQFSLSKRELEVIRLINQGRSSEEIAAQLSIGFETVRSHRKNIFMKLNINKTSELIQFAIQHHI